MKQCKWFVPIIALMVFAGCTTSASFMLPPNTSLMINDERVTFDPKDKDENGNPKYVRTPFWWNSVMGIDYFLMQDNKIIKKDKLPAEFRIASIFWPPYALFYWPVGFHFECYDLTDPKKEFIEKCPTRDEIMKKSMPPSVQSSK